MEELLDGVGRDGDEGAISLMSPQFASNEISFNWYWKTEQGWFLWIQVDYQLNQIGGKYATGKESWIRIFGS